MKIIKDLIELQQILKNLRENNKKIGLIPTMGSIHKGHLSLINQSIKMDLFSIVTIFVNPTQFNNKKDFTKYPKDEKSDITKLNTALCDLVYFPKTNDLYPKGIARKKTVKQFRNILCDKFRPGHFDGVTTVVSNLFSLINPDIAFFGEKDFQQLKIIKELVNNNEQSVEIFACPSIRLENGMSFSSRYINFSLKQKNIFNNVANKICKSVSNLRQNISLDIINNLSKELINLGVSKIDYLEIREDKNLSEQGIENLRLFVAFYINEIRIIDNFKLY